MSTTYQVQVDNSTRLPMTCGAVVEAWKRGQVRPDTLIWREGLEQWLPAHALRDELNLPEQIGGFAPTPVISEDSPTVPVERESYGLAAVLIVAGLALAGFFMIVYETRATDLVAFSTKSQNRMFGVAGGGGLVLVGVLVALFRKR